MGMSFSVILERSSLCKIGDKYAKGAIVVKVDTSHGGWDKSYDAFIHWIKSHVSQKSVLTWVFPNAVPSSSDSIHVVIAQQP